MSLLDDIGGYLQTAGVGTLGTDLFLGELRTSPEASVAVIETPGEAPIDAFGPNGTAPLVARPHFQVVARADGYQAARTKAQAAWDALAGVTETTLGTTRYLRIEPMQSPFYLGRDEAGDHIVAANFRVTVEA